MTKFVTLSIDRLNQVIGALNSYCNTGEIDCADDLVAELLAERDQKQSEQEPVAWLRGLPEGTTHISASKAKIRSGGQIDVSMRAFKYADGVLMVYVTDNDNEYPGWRKASDAFYHLNFPLASLYIHPHQRARLTDEQIDAMFSVAATGEYLAERERSRHLEIYSFGVRDSESAHGIK